MLPGPPTVYQSILDHPRLAEFDMSSLRLAVTGAAAVPVVTRRVGVGSGKAEGKVIITIETAE